MRYALTVCLLLSLAACSTEAPEAPRFTVPTESSQFRSGLLPGQQLSAGAFPNDALLAGGKVSIATLSDDPGIAGSAKPEQLAIWDEMIAQRSGFSFAAPVWFFMDETPELSTIRVEIITLSGPELGKVSPVELFWNEQVGALGAFIAFGHYLIPDTTYAALVHSGGTTDTGAPLRPPADFIRLLVDEATGDSGPHVLAARDAYAPLRAWLADNPTVDPTMGTVFTTEPVLAFGDPLIAAVESYALKPVSDRVWWNKEKGEWVVAEAVVGDDLDQLYGVAEAPHEFNPGLWGSGTRSRANYTGGSGHFGLGAVINGSVMIPSYNQTVDTGKPVSSAFEYVDGKPVMRAEVVAPFTLILCEAHMDDPANVPIAIFNHGGGVSRQDVLAYANANCRVGIATVALDMIFHGSRRARTWLADEKVIAGSHPDTLNEYTTLSEGDPGYMPDYIGDPGPSAVPVGNLFSVESGADPRIIEANQATISLDTYALYRYLKEGDWSAVWPGLGFDMDNLFHSSLSFGSSYGTMLQAYTPAQRIGVGFSAGNTTGVGPTGAASGLGRPMYPDELEARMGIVEQLGINEIDIWEVGPDMGHQRLSEPFLAAMRQYVKGPNCVCGTCLPLRLCCDPCVPPRGPQH